jgi:CheY-like chemotaxis protein
VVDDNRDAAEMIAEYLSGIGYTTVVALDARQALAALRARMTDLALLDIGLPETDGYELAQAIVTEYGPRAPRLVAITGYAQASDRERALQVGFAEHLPKPVDLPRLATTLRRLAREGQT